MKKNLVLSVLFFCFFCAEAGAFTHSVVMNNIAFEPQTLRINQGDTVEWNNIDGRFFGGIPHTTTSGTNCAHDGTGWDSGTLFLGHTFQVTLNTPGEYPYFCRLHCPAPGGDMVGRIIVNPAETPVMPLPGGQQPISYDPVSFPVVDADPPLAKPVGIGDLADGGPTITVRIQTTALSAPVNVFFAVAYAGTIYILTPAGLMEYAATGLVPWMTGVTGPLDIEPFGVIPVSALPGGMYTFYLAVIPEMPVSLFLPYYIWQTSALIP